MGDAEKYHLRPATEQDIPAILSINHAYFPIEDGTLKQNIEEVLNKKKYGFLLSKFTEEEVMPDEDLLALLKWEAEGKDGDVLKSAVLGDPSNPSSILPAYSDSPLASYDVISSFLFIFYRNIFDKMNILQNENCVSPEYLGKGVGTFALKKLWENPSLVLPPEGKVVQKASTTGAIFYCYIVTGPYYNEPSIKFSEKLGYKRVGTFAKDFYADLDKYESLCYVKVVNSVNNK